MAGTGRLLRTMKMKIKRRDIVSLGAAGAFSAALESAQTKAKAGKGPATKPADSRWQSYADSGIYPPQTHLLLDDFFIDHLGDATRVLHPPQMVGDGPVM